MPAPSDWPDRALTVVGWLAGFWLLRHLPGPRRLGPSVIPTGTGTSESPPDDPRVSVIVPARNEGQMVGLLLASLEAQSVAPSEVIVVDDHSSDSTTQAACSAGATVIRSEDLPEGWTGKSWACHQGAQVARGEILMFLDADVTLAPDALDRLVDERRRAGGLISIQPFHRVERPYERLSAVCNTVGLMGTGAFTGPPRRPPTMAFGPCLIASREDYDQAGGHTHPDVRGQITEDLALAQRFVATDQTVRMLAGRDAVSFRMYPGGLHQLIEGWTKMLGRGAGSSRPGVAAAVFLWTTAALVVSREGTKLALRWVPRPRWAGLRRTRPQGALSHRRGASGPFAAASYVAFAAQCWWMFRRIGRFGVVTSLLFPLPLVAFVCLFVRSAVLTALNRPVSWRGRAFSPR